MGNSVQMVALLGAATAVVLSKKIKESARERAREMSSDPAEQKAIGDRLSGAVHDAVGALSGDLDKLAKGHPMRSAPWPDRQRLGEEGRMAFEFAQTIKARIFALLIDPLEREGGRAGAGVRAEVAMAAALAREPDTLAKALSGGRRPWRSDCHGGESGLALAACWSGSHGSLELLLGAGAPWGGRADGVGALGLAACSSAKALGLLLAAGADPNERDARGATALMRAAAWGPRECVDALLERADPWALDDEGRMAADWAAGAGREDLARLIRSRTRGLDDLACRLQQARDDVSRWRGGKAAWLPKRPGR